ncbi:MAG TPA: hypothetical protein VN457_04735, partial [Chlamydiales bacterium]|nr:hypothetical protein [Chlamydiales bacterium]
MSAFDVSGSPNGLPIQPMKLPGATDQKAVIGKAIAEGQFDEVHRLFDSVAGNGAVDSAKTAQLLSAIVDSVIATKNFTQVTNLLNHIHTHHTLNITLKDALFDHVLESKAFGRNDDCRDKGELDPTNNQTLYFHLLAHLNSTIGQIVLHKLSGHEIQYQNLDLAEQGTATNPKVILELRTAYLHPALRAKMLPTLVDGEQKRLVTNPVITPIIGRPQALQSQRVSQTARRASPPLPSPPPEALKRAARALTRPDLQATGQSVAGAQQKRSQAAEELTKKKFVVVGQGDHAHIKLVSAKSLFQGREVSNTFMNAHTITSADLNHIAAIETALHDNNGPEALRLFKSFLSDSSNPSIVITALSPKQLATICKEAGPEDTAIIFNYIRTLPINMATIERMKQMLKALTHATIDDLGSLQRECFKNPELFKCIETTIKGLIEKQNQECAQATR